MDKSIDIFIDELRQSISSNTFVSLSLGNYKGTDQSLQKLLMRPIESRKGRRLLLQQRRRDQDLFETLDHDDALKTIAGNLAQGFRSGHLFTTERDLQLTIGKRSAHIKRTKPTFTSIGPLEHDREKKRLVDPAAFWLKALGIANDAGKIVADQQSKWRQINKFVEILQGLVESSGLNGRDGLRIIDMGSGKGYLTFAAAELFAPSSVRITGVEARPNLVALCNEIAAAGGYDGLNFVQGSIADFDATGADILIALHACDTATDDALFKGVAAGASIIVAAPCCHHEIKAQLKSPELLAGILKHPVMHERTAETVTDGLRSLLLEREGYKTKIFEFVATEHTPKNNMLVATLTGQPDREAISTNIAEIKAFFGIREHRLETLLASQRSPG